MEMWRKCGEAASAAALYSVYSGLYSEAVVSSVASAVALAEVGQFKEAMQYVQRAAKALYEAAREVFEKVKITVQRLVELFVEAVARVLAWIDEHKAYLFLMADPYERFKEIAKAANAGRVKLAEPWESLRALIMPTPSEERRHMKGVAYRELDERKEEGPLLRDARVGGGLRRLQNCVERVRG
jgi:hypothetical protein